MPSPAIAVARDSVPTIPVQPLVRCDDHLVANVRDWVKGGRHPGRFWLPSSPDRRVPGLLEIEDGRQPSIYLWDFLEERAPAGVLAMPITQEFPLVFGSVGRGDVTLIDTHASHIGIGPNDELPGTLKARAGYLGAPYEAHVLAHDHIRVRMDGLASLVPFTPYTMTWDAAPIHRWEIDTSQEVAGRFGDIDVCLRLIAINAGWTAGEAPPRHEILSTEVVLEGKTAGPLGLLDWIERLITPMRSLVGFALGRRLPLRRLDRLDPYPDLDGRMIVGSREVPIVGSGIELNAPVTRNLIRGPIVAFNDTDLMEQWHRMWSVERKRDAVQRMLHATSPGSSLKTLFTDLVEAAEGWHNAVHGRTYLDTNGARRTWTLAARLDDLLVPLRGWGLVGVPTGAELSRCRNDVAHGDVLPDLGRLPPLTRALRVALRYHIAVELGVDQHRAAVRAQSADSWSPSGADAREPAPDGAQN